MNIASRVHGVIWHAHEDCMIIAWIACTYIHTIYRYSPIFHIVHNVCICTIVAIHNYCCNTVNVTCTVQCVPPYSMQSLLPLDDLYPSDYDADTVTPVGRDLQCQGREARGRVTLKKTDNLMYEFEVPEALSYRDLEGMSHNLQRVVFHGMSDYALSDTVLHPSAQRFINEYQPAVLQHSHSTSKLWPQCPNPPCVTVPTYLYKWYQCMCTHLRAAMDFLTQNAWSACHVWALHTYCTYMYIHTYVGQLYFSDHVGPDRTPPGLIRQHRT